VTRVCLYTRISTDEENQPTSLHSQRERLEAFCRAQEDWQVVVHEEDRATGTKLDRPGLKAALGLARAGKIDLILVYRVDRLSRKVRQLAQLAEELDALGVVLRSATEPFDTGSPAGRMMLQMLAVFAEFEHATIVDRVTAGIERRAKEGRWATGRLPFGYRRNASKEVVPDDVQAPVVRRVFDLYVRERLGTVSVARRLSDEQAPAPPRGWQPAAVQWLLSNEAYLGRVHWRGQSYAGLHEPIVDEETFARAQALLAERGEDVARRRGNASDFLLSGVLRCGHCKRAYVGMSAKGNGGTYHYYACSGRQKLGARACSGDRLSRDQLEQAVIAQLVSLYRDGELVRAALARAVEESKRTRPRLNEQLAAVRTELAAAERARVRYFDAVEAGTLSPTLCEERLTALGTRLADLRAQEAELALSHDQEGERGLSEADLQAVADRLETVISGGRPEKAKALLRLLIKELRVNGKAEILPTYRVVTPEVCATPSSVGGTGLEPVTPSLSSWCDRSRPIGWVRSDGMVRCFPGRAANRRARERTVSVAIVATRLSLRHRRALRL
jgi:site-specific DNA recombinase